MAKSDDIEYFDEVFGKNNKPTNNDSPVPPNYIRCSNGILHRRRH